MSKITILFLLIFLQYLYSQNDQVTYLPGYGTPFEKQFAGHIQVNAKHGGHLFYWFFESRNPTPSTPVLLWLNGGPGCSSLTGLFAELGPYFVDPNNSSRLLRNPFSWTEVAHVIFIDQPVGVGLSFVEQSEGYVRNQYELSAQLHNALVQFFEMHPEYKNLDLYLTGESYAGKYIPSLADYILEKGGLNLKGIAVGNGLIHPLVQRLIKADQAYWNGLIGYRQREMIRGLQARCIRHILQGKYNERDNEEGPSPCGQMAKFIEIAAGPNINLYDTRKFEPTVNKTLFVAYLNKPEVRTALNVKKVVQYEETCSQIVYEHLRNDILLSVRDIIPKLVNAKKKVLLFAGNYDMKDAPYGIEQFLLQLNISGYNTQFRKLWLVDGKMAGYVISLPYFSFVTVHGAGHFVPTDQPKHALDMITRFIQDKPFCTPEQSLSFDIESDSSPHKLETVSLTCDVGQYLCANVVQCKNGVCVGDGSCKCNEGWTGMDCSSRIEILQNKASAVLEQQEWMFFEKTIESSSKSLILASLITNSTTFNDSRLEIGGGIGGNQPNSAVCIYGQKDTLPSLVDFKFVDCSGSEQLLLQLDPGKWYFGVFNSQPFRIKFELNFDTGVVAGHELNILVQSYWFWFPVAVEAVVIFGLSVLIVILLWRQRKFMTQHLQLNDAREILD